MNNTTDSALSAGGSSEGAESPSGSPFIIVVGPTLYKHKLSYLGLEVAVFVVSWGIFFALNYQSFGTAGASHNLWTWMSFCLMPMAPFIAEALWGYWMIEPYQKVNRSKSYLENCLIGAFGTRWEIERRARQELAKLISFSQEASLRVLIIIDATVSMPELEPSTQPFEPIDARSQPDRVAEMLDAVAYSEQKDAKRPNPAFNPRDAWLGWVLMGAAMCLPMFAYLAFGMPIYSKVVVILVVTVFAVAVYFQFRYWRDGAVFFAPKTVVFRTPRWRPAKICQSPDMLLVADVRDGTLYLPRNYLPHLAVRCSPAACLLAAWAWISEADAPDDESLKRYVDAS